MSSFGFIGPSYTGRAKTVAAERCVNLYLEHVETQEGKSPAVLIGTPGTSVFATLDTAPCVRGLWLEPTTLRVFAVASNVLYEIGSGGAVTSRGTFAEPAGLSSDVSMRSNGTQLVISSNGAGYLFTLATNSLKQLNLANFPFVNSNSPGANGFPTTSQFEFFDTYLIALSSGTQQFFWSFVNDASDWSSLNFASKSSWPDNLISMILNQRLLWLMGSQRSEVWYDSGDPFARVQGAQIETGIVAQSSLHRQNNTICWLGGDERGQGIAFAANGYQPQRISNHAVEYEWSLYSSISDCIAWGEQHGGHFWSVYTFPSGDATWVYDHSTQVWHQRTWMDPNTGVQHQHLARNHTFAFGKHLIGDRQSGNIYTHSLNTYADNGNAIKRTRACPVFQEHKWIYYRSLDLYATMGQGLVSGQGSNPVVNLRISDDGGFTWGNEIPEYLGKQGDYTYRCQWRRLGRSRDRVYEVSTSEPIPISFTDAYLEIAGANGR